MLESRTLMKKKKRFYILLDHPVAEMFEQWCAENRRDPPHTLRTVIELWLAEGIDEAERRIKEGIDRPAQKSSPPAGIPGSTAAERAEYLVTGKVPATKHKSNAG